MLAFDQPVWAGLSCKLSLTFSKTQTKNKFEWSELSLAWLDLIECHENISLGDRLVSPFIDDVFKNKSFQLRSSQFNKTFFVKYISEQKAGALVEIYRFHSIISFVSKGSPTTLSITSPSITIKIRSTMALILLCWVSMLTVIYA